MQNILIFFFHYLLNDTKYFFSFIKSNSLHKICWKTVSISFSYNRRITLLLVTNVQHTVIGAKLKCRRVSLSNTQTNALYVRCVRPEKKKCFYVVVCVRPTYVCLLTTASKRHNTIHSVCVSMMFRQRYFKHTLFYRHYPAMRYTDIDSRFISFLQSVPFLQLAQLKPNKTNHICCAPFIWFDFFSFKFVDSSTSAVEMHFVIKKFEFHYMNYFIQK